MQRIRTAAQKTWVRVIMALGITGTLVIAGGAPHVSRR